MVIKKANRPEFHLQTLEQAKNTINTIMWHMPTQPLMHILKS